VLNSNLHDRLRALGTKTILSKPSQSSSSPERYSLLADRIGGNLVENESGTFVTVSRMYPFGCQYGDMRLEESFVDSCIPLSAFLVKDAGREVNPSQLLFIDTETTGLGGAGTVPFLVGVGRFTDGGFEVKQFLLPDYSDERAMLSALLADFSNSSVLVSYNGAAFDIPILQDRIIINRCDRQPQFELHLDILHSTRRLFRRRLKDCSLMNLEKALLGFERGEDIPGYLIPSVFFDWVSNQKSDQMGAVLEHNRHDIVSLCLLFFHLKELFVTNGAQLLQVDDLYSLSRLYGRRREHYRSLTACERITDIAGERVADDILLHQGFVCKRLGQFDRAVELWTLLADKSVSSGREGARAEEELAKLFEHQLRDLNSAERFAERIVARCQSSSLSAEASSLAAKRLARIRGKRSKL
jgi:uncharacterized protein